MASICQRIETHRSAGRVTCNFFHGSDVLPRRERLKRLGYRDIPDELWVSVDPEEAQRVLVDCLSRDLAYRTELMSNELAQELAVSFLSGFENSARFLTNSRRFLKSTPVNSLYGWEPVSHASFDTGILVEDGGVIGILWVEDED